QHERWDGSGGPHGLRGPDIPSSSRLLAVASTMVGMPGPHRPPNWTARRRRVRELAGSALDPELVRHAVSGRLDEDDPEPRLEQIIDRLDDFVVERGHSPVEALASIGAAVRAAHSIPDVLVVIGEQARRALGADRVSVGRLDHAGRTVEVLVNIGDLGPDDERFPAHEQHPLDGPIGLGKVLGGEGLIRSIDEGRADDPATASLHQRGLRSEAVWPIAIDDTVWGVVWATTSADGGLLAHDRLDTLRSVTTHVASAVTQAERRAEFEALALRDPLTGLGNRRVLDMKLHEVFSRPSVDRRDVGLIMCDVDGLKVVNDNRGHAAGDELLIEAARALQEAAATVDGALVCRIGGDEFCIILDGGGLLSAHPVADLAGNLFSATGEGRSLSIGVAIVGPGVESPFDLLRTADDAQYAQKRARKGIDPVDEAVDTASRRRHRRG
ncbi:MAG: diguanylate cyclase domain-containing protein, partial [Acidimicrobiales bacterium]